MTSISQVILVSIAQWIKYSLPTFPTSSMTIHSWMHGLIKQPLSKQSGGLQWFIPVLDFKCSVCWNWSAPRVASLSLISMGLVTWSIVVPGMASTKISESFKMNCHEIHYILYLSCDFTAAF